MPLNTVGTGGILLTTLAVLDAEHSVGDDFIPLIGLVMLWFDFTPKHWEGGCGARRP
jgi:hypothetical protein